MTSRYGNFTFHVQSPRQKHLRHGNSLYIGHFLQSKAQTLGMMDGIRRNHAA